MTRITEVTLTLHAEQSRALARGATMLVVQMVVQPTYFPGADGGRWGTYGPCPFPPGAVLVGREEFTLPGGEYPTIYSERARKGVVYQADLDYYDSSRLLNEARTMPTWASRHRYLIASVDARRVQSVTEAEAKLCGLERRNRGFAAYEGDGYYPQARLSFASFIRTIYGPSAWTENRYCWFLTLDRAARAAERGGE
jgi:hypothetical protein